MKKSIFKSNFLCLGLFLMAFTLCSFTGPNGPEKEQKSPPEQQVRGGGDSNHFIHAAATDEYVEFQVGEPCWFTIDNWEYTFKNGVATIYIGTNPNEQWREIRLTFSSDCMGMDRLLLIGQDGTQYPYIEGDDKG